MFISSFISIFISNFNFHFRFHFCGNCHAHVQVRVQFRIHFQFFVWRSRRCTSQKDEGGVVLVEHEDAVFLSDQDVVRYHPSTSTSTSAMTVSRMTEEGTDEGHLVCMEVACCV